MSESNYPFESWWYRKYASRRAEVAAQDPESLARFEAQYKVLDGPPGFREHLIRGFLSPHELAQANEAVASIAIADWRQDHLAELGRWTVDDPEFASALHHRMRPWLSALVGEELECSYTLLGMYNRMGALPVHIDSPNSKWTIDICLRQSAVWPLHVSKVCDWREFDPCDMNHMQRGQDMKTDPSLEFNTVYLEPGDAVVFCSSAQWHWRDSIPLAGGDAFCDLLFLSYAPAGFSQDSVALRSGIPDKNHPA